MADSTIRKSDKHVFLLGAGFSVAYGAPIMRDFMAVARRRYFPLRQRNPVHPLVQRYEATMHFQEECARCSRAFNRDWDNIEELYTQADLRRLAKYPDSEKADELCRHIAWVIWDVYRNYNQGEHPPMHAVVEKAVEEGHRPVIITTNYDVLSEIGVSDDLDSPWRWFYPGFTTPWSCNNPQVLEEDRNVTRRAAARLGI